MISILHLTAAATLLISLATGQQQPQLVYEQHFSDTPQAHQYPDAQNTKFQPFPQDYTQSQPNPQYQNSQVDSNGYFQQSPPLDQQQQQQPLGFSPQHPQSGHYQGPPTHQHGIGIPIPMSQMQNQQPFMYPQQQPQQFGNLPPPPQGGFQQQPQMIPVGMSPHEFADRRGPLDNMLKGRSPFKMSKKKKPKPFRARGRGPPVKMMEMNRIPKPPKYPLYDMPSIGMATPPPAPLMHPMSHMAASNAYSTFVKPQHGGPPQRRNHQPPNRRRPAPPPPNRPGKKRPPIPGNHNQRNHRRPPPGKKHFHNSNNGYEHPMASNLDPQVNSPPLGRPLSFDEYMERPSHSFTDDPWNFDPFAAQYNSGMNTYAMKYNYDPLGMNVVDGSQSHLDPQKLSYPGDYFSLQDTSAVLKSPKNSQLGGWDKPPETYRSAIPNLLPPPLKESDKQGPHADHHNGYNRHQHHDRYRGQERDRDRDQYRSESAPAPVNSFNVFDSASADSNIVKSEASSSISLLGDSGTSAPIEFSIENTGGGDEQYQSQYNIGQEGGPPPHSRHNYGGSHQGRQPYQPSQSSFSDSEFAQSQSVNENYSPNDNPVDSYARKQDYEYREKPLHNLSDSYSPLGDLSTAMSPPGDNSDTLFRRNGMRATRQENTPMVEMDGLSLFKDVLRNANASGARKHLYSALLN